FEEAKAYVLARREVLRKEWESHGEPTAKKRLPKSGAKLVTAPAPETDEPEMTRPEIWEEDDFLVELGGEG
ncbi:MAG: hypothetical protein ACRD4Y_07365, partial [Candidatus Acidiferrales bacterium]